MTATPNPAGETPDAPATVYQTIIVTAATQEPPADESAAPQDPAAAERQARKDQALLTGQAALALLDRYHQELLQIYPELQGRIYGEDDLPAGSPPELAAVYEDRETLLQGMGAIEEIGTWLHAQP